MEMDLVKDWDTKFVKSGTEWYQENIFQLYIVAEALRARGFYVTLQRSDWNLPASAKAMVAEMITSTASAASELHASPSVVAKWRADRERCRELSL